MKRGWRFSQIVAIGILGYCSAAFTQNLTTSPLDVQSAQLGSYSSENRTANQPSTTNEALTLLLPHYHRVSGISGNLSSSGSDTLANLMTYWAEEFKRRYPNVHIQIQTAGSSTAPTALTEATAQLGPMSRQMKTKEIEAFEHEYGYPPTEIRVAIDALAVFVHEDNPLKGLNFKQLDAIYSRTYQCGAVEPITRWGQLGLTGSWQHRPIQLFGRNSVSGTYGYFKKRALCRGDFRSNVNEQPGSASVAQSVSTSLNGIGYSGIGYKTTGIRAIPIAREGNEYVEATIDNSVSGRYPLARYLYVYVNKKPNKPLAPIVQEFFRFVLSQDGQQIVQKDGYVPVPQSVVEQDLIKLGLGHNSTAN
ncbi:PstS family phosphate ABC transporter substrate-binding protein [Photobacterium damselae]|uniref:Phosphate-binding protein n=1 Tax=Photobacterium damselae subsp. damselae TaxID=85581 RepID=A0A855RPD1_PHODD|nr:phosphate ABC transporter substrate-binding protein PstS family protein [Photobacterium damselae]NVP01758.1 phosphate ABC transporter substrate-binding protein PstS family protein [Photobacterium damselae subsp. damselae]OEC82814.1 phosphate ABC transporter substrate-binding protein [Photobacterium damselae subsp. damselae]PSB80640.1 phosphate ABC transporter substrate-binding protein [Photobacterium damselae subsp. damselae]TGZ36254.1 Phosphate-binding protein PstS [Photobacterium damselae 